MIKLVGQVGNWVGQLAHPHDTIHQLRVTGERADVRLVPLLLGSLEIDYGFLAGLNHSGAGYDAGVPLGLPVLLDSLVTEFQDRIDHLLSAVPAFLLSWSA